MEPLLQQEGQNEGRVSEHTENRDHQILLRDQSLAKAGQSANYKSIEGRKGSNVSSQQDQNNPVNNEESMQKTPNNLFIYHSISGQISNVKSFNPQTGFVVEYPVDMVQAQ